MHQCVALSCSEVIQPTLLSLEVGDTHGVSAAWDGYPSEGWEEVGLVWKKCGRCFGWDLR